jgi:hypothetical protein
MSSERIVDSKYHVISLLISVSSAKLCADGYLDASFCYWPLKFD